MYLQAYVHVRVYVRPSVYKSFSDFNEIWQLGRGRWVMHDGMQYDLIQGQGYEPFKVTMGAGNWPLILKLGTISKFDWAGFLIFVLVYVTSLWTWQKRQLRRVDRQSRIGLIYQSRDLRLSVHKMFLPFQWNLACR